MKKFLSGASPRWMSRRHAAVTVAGALVASLAGFSLSTQIGPIVGQSAPGDVTCTTATATASVPDRTLTGPDHVLGRDGSPVYTEPGDIVTSPGITDIQQATACVTEPAATTVTVTSPTTTITPPPPPPPPTNPIEDKSSFDGRSVLADWPNAYDPPAASGTLGSDGWQPQRILDPLGSGLLVQTLSTTPNDVGSPSTAQRNDLDDWRYQTGTDPVRQLRGNKWFSWEVMFPSSGGSVNGVPYARFHPVNGEWNWIYQFHRNSTIGGTGSGSESEVGILTDSPSDGANPRFLFRMCGGKIGSVTASNVYYEPGVTCAEYRSLSANFRFDHWYRFIFNINFATDNTGYWKVWLDGSPVIDQTQAAPINWVKRVATTSGTWPIVSTERKQQTLLQNSNLYIDFPYVMLSNYHRKTYLPSGTVYQPVTWNSSIFFREWKIGASAASVGSIP